MKSLFAAIILICALCSTTPSDSQTNPQKTHSGAGKESYKNALEQKAEIRRLHQELRSRAILRSLGDRIDRTNLDFLEQKFGVKTFPEFRGLTESEINLKIEDLEKHLTWKAMTYGNNNLQDLYVAGPETMEPELPYVKDANVLKASRSVVAIVHKESLKLRFDGTYLLKVQPLKEINGNLLCEFSDFYNAAHTDVAGTGFLVADSIIATAGHVYDNRMNLIEDYYFVFDYKMLTPWMVKTIYTDQEVYQAKELTKRMNIDGNDWALIRLQRHVEGREPLGYRSGGKVDSDAKLYLLGHPYGLPMKYSGIGRVLNNISCHFFTSNIDNYEYNSGSPVFDRSSNTVEGILCRDLGPEVDEYCECHAPAIFRTQFGIPGVEITRSFMFASYLERYDYVTVRCSIESGFVIVDNDTIGLEMGEETLLPFNEFGMKLLTGTECWAPYSTYRGDVWEIRDGPEGRVIMAKVCE